MGCRDYFKVLGVERGCRTPGRSSVRFRKLPVSFHPDVNIPMTPALSKFKRDQRGLRSLLPDPEKADRQINYEPVSAPVTGARWVAVLGGGGAPRFDVDFGRYGQLRRIFSQPDLARAASVGSRGGQWPELLQVRAGGRGFGFFRRLFPEGGIPSGFGLGGPRRHSRPTWICRKATINLQGLRRGLQRL